MESLLEPNERASLREFLVGRFALDELKNLAFDLGVDYESFPHQTTSELSRGLIAYFERNGNLSCLLEKVLNQRPDGNIGQLLAKLRPCSPRTKVQIILSNGRLKNKSEVLEQLVKVFKEIGNIEIAEDGLMLIGAVHGSIRLLVSLPEKAANVLTASEIHGPVDSENHRVSIVAFDSLDEVSQNAWRLVSLYLPSLRRDGILLPDVSWEKVVGAVRLAASSLTPSLPRSQLLWYAAGDLLADMGRWEESLAAYDQALALAPFAQAYYKRGVAYYYLQRYDEALAACTLALELDPTLAQAYNKRGAIYAEWKRYDDALANFTYAIELDPIFEEPYTNRGATYANLQRYDEALADFARAIELDPNDAQAYTNRGFTYTALQRDDEALADFTRAIELKPNNAQTYLGRGVTYANLQRYDEALADFARAIDLDPNDAQAYTNRGITYANLQRNDEALADFTRAIELDPDQAQAHLHIGVLLIIRGALRGALPYLEKAAQYGLQQGAQLAEQVRERL
jgi:tetratricopeptide (TPR) repeat protein